MNKLLVVIDMQNDFIDGALGSEMAQGIVENVRSRIFDLGKGDAIIMTQDTHYDDYLSTLEGKRIPIPHCIHGSHGWHIANRIHTAAFDYNNLSLLVETIQKPTFGSLALAEKARAYDPDSIEIVGLCTDICVISNAMILRAALPDTKIIVNSACCAGVTQESHERALEAMKCCGIDII